jgi:hypothetical protein
MWIPNKSLRSLGVCVPKVIQEPLLRFRRIRGISSRAHQGPAHDTVARAERADVLRRVYALEDPRVPSSQVSVECTRDLEFVLVQLGHIWRVRCIEREFGFRALVVGESPVV